MRTALQNSFVLVNSVSFTGSIITLETISRFVMWEFIQWDNQGLKTPFKATGIIPLSKIEKVS